MRANLDIHVKARLVCTAALRVHPRSGLWAYRHRPTLNTQPTLGNDSSTMPTPHTKRRRLNDASKTLHKPFKSPFRTPLKPSPQSDLPSSDDPLDPIAPETLTQPPPTKGKSVTSTVPTKPPHAITLLTTPKSTPKATPSRPTPTTTHQKTRTSPAITRELIALRADIQILSQAHTLATSSKDADLNVLAEKWRTASRAAAEELFAGTRDRVNRMGGVGAWREREREQKEWRRKWEAEDRDMEREREIQGKRENGDGEGEKEEFPEFDERDLEGGEGDGEEDAGGKDDDVSELSDGDARVLMCKQSFTMDMMLKTLNIDLKLIGYNKEGQRWDG
ncbi:hypothetical protein BCR34DRAFT_556863 [Clohesyomyces aquaticus]|uniref:Uncharacterized protein n=1 Tax=Clohesyomyces aquaticus TaxID=1231657 RepID=A0A1Y2A2E1_9PLEO|nr:hypothetical protein BCR34DRAFT_556863 [Clohesyomyces aquaticus]